MGDTIGHGEDVFGMAMGLGEAGRHTGQSRGSQGGEVNMVGSNNGDHVFVLQLAPVVHACVSCGVARQDKVVRRCGV